MTNMPNDKKTHPELKIEGKNILLRPVRISDVNEKYVGWLNDSEVAQFLETHFQTQTLQTVRDYVSNLVSGPQDSLFLAMIEKTTQKHIGNIKVGPINPHHLFADVSLFIGDKTAWGKGYATEAIRLVVRHSFQVLGLHRLNASIYDPNKGSQKAFLKAGFKEEGVSRSKRSHQGEFVDERFYGIINEE